MVDNVNIKLFHLHYKIWPSHFIANAVELKTVVLVFYRPYEAHLTG